MRLSLVGSIGWSGSTYASCLPLPLVSRINGAQPCDFSSSWVSSNFFVLNQPTTSPPPSLPPAPALLNHSVSLASNCRWCVPKHVFMSVNCLLLGSYTSSC